MGSQFKNRNQDSIDEKARMKIKQQCKLLAEACLAACGPAQKLKSQGGKYRQQTRRRLPREEQNTDNRKHNQYKANAQSNDVAIWYGMIMSY